ncbi:MAG: hypothetical protein ABIP96_03820 [Patescibacteria group bacterium]
MISSQKIQQLLERAESGQITESDFVAFLENPRLWRKTSELTQIAPEDAQAFWQSVYNELGLKIAVPTVPVLTETQVKSLDRFGFMLVFIPNISEEQYPACFVKPAWSEYLNVERIKHEPLEGQWVAIETIAKPDCDDDADYAEDRLMVAVRHDKRLHTSHNALTGGLLERVAKATGFPKKGTRLPTAEEWNFVGNLFNWLREHRSMSLPDLGSTNAWEWCQNTYTSVSQLIVGNAALGGLADVDDGWYGHGHDGIGFRVLAVL